MERNVSIDSEMSVIASSILKSAVLPSPCHANAPGIKNVFL
jgi:hypothetical protein